MPQQLPTPNVINYLVFCFVFILGTPLSASQDQLENLLELELEELMTISVVSKREESIENAPGIVTIISSDEIQRFGGRNLRDILNRQINMMVVGNHIFQENQVSLRAALNGLLDNQILYLLNGRPLTNSQGQGVHMDLYLNFPIDLGKFTEKKQLSDVKLNFYIDNLLNKNLFFPNYATRNVSTFPNYQGRSVYGTVEISF
ncbi:Plug domain-containing protein [Endozoicomonas sp. SM1973]|uniref:Plug domain-containing protein n=1 Tax=Spartinivicinus marinus TaxID=2994442 RepID=A0A853IFN4_9GAMM|nr:Plug domain-containing protein [Spartinivicinus marinus]MCX4029058.1 Plug domain-containing protein [Spartinivicinus marinus]NYZ68791.1 Plug domain-containing protein [Spartinivicinus marinus]